VQEGSYYEQGAWTIAVVRFADDWALVYTLGDGSQYQAVGVLTMAIMKKIWREGIHDIVLAE
jgi:hypothetical protein